MTEHIRTKWHRLRQLVKEDEVYITAPSGGRAEHWERLNPQIDNVEFMLDEFEKLPRFVVDSDILEIVMRDKYQYSLMDMKRAGVMRLPYSAMMIEFQHGHGHHVVMLRDLNQTTEEKFQPYPWEQGLSREKMLLVANGHPFYGVVMRIEKDQHGEYVVMGPSHIGIDVVTDAEGEPNVGLAGFALGVFACNSDMLNKIVERTWVKDGGAIFRALATAMLVMHTEGVKKEVVTCEKINRTRSQQKKPLVPRHTILSIGKVYRSRDENAKPEDYDKRRSPIPHWRRGHIRGVRYGEGREKIRDRYIPPRLVAFKEFETIEPQKGKTYQVQK